MFILMRDRANTRIRVSGITSYAPDKGYNYSVCASWPTIHMTIGSVVLILNYDKKEDRDADIELIDKSIVEE